MKISKTFNKYDQVIVMDELNKVYDELMSHGIEAEISLITDADIYIEPCLVSAKVKLKDPVQISNINLYGWQVTENLTVDEVFKGVFHRDEHVRIMHDVFTTFIEKSQSVPSHVLLYGEPSACKTTLLTRFATLYADKYDKEIIKLFDAPTLTKAGLENYIIDCLEDGSMPPILGIEEIEKCNIDNLAVLLTLMESKRIRKLNARVNVDKEANVLITATCNNAKYLAKWKNGALWSRFTHRLPCSKPNKETMYEILLQKLEERNADKLIAHKIIDFVYHTFKSEFGQVYANGDARSVIGLINNGQRLLDGSAQRDIISLIRKNGGKNVIV